MAVQRTTVLKNRVARTVNILEIGFNVIPNITSYAFNLVSGVGVVG